MRGGANDVDIRNLKLTELNPAKYNPRKELCPGDAEFEKLKRSIESFGYVELIVVNVTTGFTVISGHQRLSGLEVPIRHEWIFCLGKEPVLVNPAWRKKETSIYSGGRYNKIRQADGSFRIARRGNETGAFKKMESLLELPEQTSLESVTKQLSEKGKIRAEHPATFPVALPSEYIVAFTNEDDIVVEPFGGAGTTLIACEQLDRTCYTMELDAHYCDVIIKRWENFTGNKAKKRES